MAQGNRSVIPFDEIANDRRCILNGVLPLDAGAALGCVQRVADNDEYRNPVAIRVVDTHCRMLQPNGPMCHNPDGFSLDFRVGMSHSHRRFFMTARDEFGFLISAIINDRLVQSPETGARVRAEVLDIQRFDHINHEVRAAVIRCQNIHFSGSARFGAWVLQGCGNAPGRRSNSRVSRGGQCCRTRNGCALQEFAAIGRKFS